MGRFKITPLEMQKDATLVRNEAVEKAKKSMEITSPNPPAPPESETEGKLIQEMPRRGELRSMPMQQQKRADLERMDSAIHLEPRKAQMIKQDMPVRTPEKVNMPTPKHKRSVGEVIKDTATNLKLAVNDFRQRQEASKGG